MVAKNRGKRFGKFIKKDRDTSKIADETHVMHYIGKRFSEYPGEDALLIELLVQDYLHFNNKHLDTESLRDLVTEAVNTEKTNVLH